MDFYEKYLLMCKQHGISPSAAALQAGLTKTSVNRWKRGSIPTDANILVLADFFGCKPKDLLPDSRSGFSNDESVVYQKQDTSSDTISLDGLKEDERILLESYRTADDASRFAMQTFAKAIKKGQKDDS